MATKPNWIEEELERRGKGKLEALNDTARELHFQKVAAALWNRLATDLRADVEEFSRIGGPTEFSQPSELGVRVQRASLALTITADLAGHAVHYDYHSEQEGTVAPEGGIFSLRLSRYGRADIYSADERLTEEEARRMLLEPVLFPEEPSV